MNFPEKYKCLFTNSFISENYKILPIRYEDRIDIMKWRNEQIYHLRQEKKLTINEQNYYFQNILKSNFNEDKPSQILFSYLKNNECIGYGGLVHINWIDKNAEISFIMNTKLEKDSFSKNWSIYLGLIERLAFKELKLKKIYVYAFDLRPKLYSVLEKNGYFLDARLEDHCFFNNKFLDVVIHSKINKKK